MRITVRPGTVSHRAGHRDLELTTAQPTGARSVSTPIRWHTGNSRTRATRNTLPALVCGCRHACRDTSIGNMNGAFCQNRLDVFLMRATNIRSRRCRGREPFDECLAATRGSRTLGSDIADFDRDCKLVCALIKSLIAGQRMECLCTVVEQCFRV